MNDPTWADRMRVARCHVAAGRQGLWIREVDGSWEPMSSEGDEALLAGGRVRLADGRELKRRLSLDELEELLGIEP